MKGRWAGPRRRKAVRQPRHGGSEGVLVQISAGDSHSAALLEDGRVFAWGAFRDSHGTMGLLSGEIKKEPTLINVPDKVTMITSGADHLLLLTRHGQVYSSGCGEQGQLGRLPGRVASRESRQGLNQLLVPAPVVSNRFKRPYDRIWAGSYCTYARERDTGNIVVFGLNNYSQLAIQNKGVNENSHYHPVLSRPFSENKKWEKICGGQHHTLALDSDGLVYALGRSEYGRLGLGASTDTDVATPTIVPALRNKKCVDIACGSCVSFAVTDDGSVYAWGMGTNGQLGTGNEDDQFEPVKMEGKQLKDKKMVAVSGGGQHTVLLGVPSSIESMDQS